MERGADIVPFGCDLLMIDLRKRMAIKMTTTTSRTAPMDAPMITAQLTEPDALVSLVLESGAAVDETNGRAQPLAMQPVCKYGMNGITNMNVEVSM